MPKRLRPSFITYLTEAKISTKRLIHITIACLVVGGLWWKFFYTDKREASGPVEVPLAWLSDTVLLTGEHDKLFIRVDNQVRTEIFSLSRENQEFDFDVTCFGSDTWWFGTSIVERNNGSVSTSISKRLTLSVQIGADGHPKIRMQQEYDWQERPMLPTCDIDISEEETTAFLRGSKSYQQNRTIMIDDQSVMLESASGMFARHAEGSLFLYREPAGLIHLRGNEVTRHPFPAHYAKTLNIGKRRRWGKIIWDKHLNQALFIHNTCSPLDENKEDCRRKALWLMPSLAPLSTIEMPGMSLIEIKSGYTCFSCGCDCYSHEKIYVENGIVYLHVWGYPVVDGVRGIYRLMQTDNGPIWEKIISGRPGSPLVFSPKGDKVAYFEISRFGDEFKISKFSP